ncbi:MAG: type II toxin-antitoxin system VapC family toxin [Thermomicrobiales bacterium]
MTYLIDSDWIIDWLKGRPDAHTLFQKLAIDLMAVSAVAYGEVYEGVYYGRNRQQVERAFRQFMRGVTVIPMTRPIAHQYGIIRGDLRQRGLTIGDPDIMIAATALHHSMTLVTQNFHHFHCVTNLTLYQI